MSASSADSAADFEFGAIRRGVVTVWFISTEDPAAALGSVAAHDRGFGRRFLALYDSTLPVTPIGDFPLNRSAETGNGEYYIGGFEGVAVLQTVLDDVSQLSKLPARLRQEISATDVYAVVSDKATGFGAFAHWENGELKRAFAATRYRTLEDIGLPSPAEGDYWAGKHRPTFPTAPASSSAGEGSGRREGVDLPFVPAELADAVLTSWLGFDPHSPAADIPVSGFAVDGRRAAPAGAYSGSRQAHRGAQLSAGSGSSAAAGSGAADQADENGRVYDDYEVHGGEPSRDIVGEIANIGEKTRNFASRVWNKARRGRRK